MANRLRSVRRGGVLLLGLSLAAGAALLPAQAQDNPDVKARSQLMKAMGKSMKTMGPMFKGKVPYDAEAVKAAALVIQENSGPALTKLFPEGSTDPKSYALPAIWTDWDRFANLAGDLKTYSAGLVAAADNPRTPAEAPAEGGTLGSQATLGDAAKPAMTLEAAELAAMSPDVVFQAVAETCGTCHTDFRKDDD